MQVTHLLYIIYLSVWFKAVFVAVPWAHALQNKLALSGKKVYFK